MGSVKDLRIIKPATAEKMGVGVFHFTDDYSVFDYGKMPDVIPGKGEALCRMAAYNFEKLAGLGIKSHFRKLVKGNEMEVNLVRVLYPQKGEISTETKNYLVPLEVVWRNSLPGGSSVFKSLEKGELKPSDLGLDHMPKPGEKLPKPVLDFWTKLEETDRKLSENEAMEIAGLSGKEFEEMKKKALKINSFINEKAKDIGLEHADGKAEFAVSPENEIILVDVVGTLDENRMLFNGIHVSKQVIRDYYKALPWGSEIMKAKEAGKAARITRRNNMTRNN
jgi:phosphoribosylaminoimidazole-succinocarboxamide synthase